MEFTYFSKKNVQGQCISSNGVLDFLVFGLVGFAFFWFWVSWIVTLFDQFLPRPRPSAGGGQKLSFYTSSNRVWGLVGFAFLRVFGFLNWIVVLFDLFLPRPGPSAGGGQKLSLCTSSNK